MLVPKIGISKKGNIFNPMQFAFPKRYYIVVSYVHASKLHKSLQEENQTASIQLFIKIVELYTVKLSIYRYNMKVKYF